MARESNASAAYRSWKARGRKYRLARPIADLKTLARGAGVQFLGDIGNNDHLWAPTPEDHTPFSATAWPVPLPDDVVTAIDLADGPWSDRILADAKAGRLPWLKYMNFRGGNYSTKRGWGRTSSSDWHLHLSIRSDFTYTTIGAYNPFTAPAPPEEDDVNLWDKVGGTATADHDQNRSVEEILMDLWRGVHLDLRGRPPAGQLVLTAEAVESLRVLVRDVVREELDATRLGRAA